MQSFFIGIGAVLLSMLPWLLAKAGFANTTAAGEIPDTVRYAFYVGAVGLLAAVGWTMVSSHEYRPEVLEAFDDAIPAAPTGAPALHSATISIVLGDGLLTTIALAHRVKELFILAGGVLGNGVALVLLGRARRGCPKSGPAKCCLYRNPIRAACRAAATSARSRHVCPHRDLRLHGHRAAPS